MSVELAIAIIVLLVIILLAIITFYCSIIKKFMDYDRDNKVPEDIEEVVSKKIFSQPKIREESEFHPTNAKVQSNHESEGESLRRFISEAVIPKAEGQRTSWQFAVLVLLARSETKRPQTFQFKPNKNSRLPIDPSKPFIPAKSEFNNYIVARPEQDVLNRITEYYRIKFSQHAEKIVVDEFEDLLLAYVRENKEDLGGIILYSWVMPCTECTNKIIDTLAGRKLKVTVAYTLRCKLESERIQHANRERLRQAGATVEYIQYENSLQKKSS